MSTKEDLIRKYADRTPEEMEKEQDKIEQEYNLMSQDLDQKLTKASSKIDIMKFGEAEIHIKRPTKAQLNRLIPPELAKYRKNPKEIPYELAKEYESDIMKLMEELIIMPKHNAKTWSETIGDEFIAAFQAHLVNLQTKIQEEAKGFLRQTSDTQS